MSLLVAFETLCRSAGVEPYNFMTISRSTTCFIPLVAHAISQHVLVNLILADSTDNDMTYCGTVGHARENRA
jgi:hypothetical protein